MTRQRQRKKILEPANVTYFSRDGRRCPEGADEGLHTGSIGLNSLQVPYLSVTAKQFFALTRHPLLCRERKVEGSPT